MEIFLVNTDAKSNQLHSYHNAWITRGIAVTSGRLKTETDLSRISRGDLVGMYVKLTGLVAVGVPLDDQTMEVRGLGKTVSPLEPVERHRRMSWLLDLRQTPLSVKTLRSLGVNINQHPVRHVQTDTTLLRRRLQQLFAEPTSDEEGYERRAAVLQRMGLVLRPVGVPCPVRFEGRQLVFLRDPAVRAWVLHRAQGTCEHCGRPSPFMTELGLPYLETHHIIPLSEDGPDTPDNVAAVCPNCHRELHHGCDKVIKRERLQRSVLKRESLA